MILKSILVKNFMPFKGVQVIDFPDSPTQNVTVIFGNNMRGKTSILNAFRWGFYQTAIGRHSKEIPLFQLANKESGSMGDWDFEIQVRFSANGDEYDLRRTASMRKHIPRPEKNEDFEINVSMTKNGTPVLGGEIPTEINKFAPEQVSRFFLFDGELLQEYETLLIEGNEQGKRIKEAIEQVLGVPALINGREASNILLKKATKLQNQEMRQFAGAELMIENRKTIQSKIDLINNDIRNVKKRLDQIRDERSGLDDYLDQVESVFQSKALLEAKKSQLKRAKDELAEFDSQKLGLLADSWKILIDKKIAREIEKLELRKSEIEASINKGKEHDIEINQLKRIISFEKCPTCDQEVLASHRNLAAERLDALNAMIKQHDRSLENVEIISKIQQLSSIRNVSIYPALVRCESLSNSTQISSIKLENEMEHLEQEIQGFDTIEITRMRAKRDVLIKDEGRTEAAINDSNIELSRLNRELRMIDASINSLPQARSMRSSKQVAIYTALERIFSESIEGLRDSLRNQVESYASEAFSQLTTQKQYSGLKINDNYGLTILDEKLSAVNIRSAGAEQIVALSLIDGLSRTGRSAGPVVMDTPFGRLDLKHRDNILSYIPTSAKQLILLVHDGEIRSKDDLSSVASRIGATYTIHGKGPRFSEIRKDSQNAIQ